MSASHRAYFLTRKHPISLCQWDLGYANFCVTTKTHHPWDTAQGDCAHNICSCYKQNFTRR